MYLLYICKAMSLMANYSISIRTKTILMILFWCLSCVIPACCSAFIVSPRLFYEFCGMGVCVTKSDIYMLLVLLAVVRRFVKGTGWGSERYRMRLYKVQDEALKNAEWASQTVSQTAYFVINRVGEKSHCCVRTSRKAQSYPLAGLVYAVKLIFRCLFVMTTPYGVIIQCLQPPDTLL